MQQLYSRTHSCCCLWCLQVDLLNMEDFEAEHWTSLLGDAQLVLLLTSTHGPGACPASANKFLSWLKQHDAAKPDSVLRGMRCCVLILLANVLLAGGPAQSHAQHCAVCAGKYSQPGNACKHVLRTLSCKLYAADCQPCDSTSLSCPQTVCLFDCRLQASHFVCWALAAAPTHASVQQQTACRQHCYQLQAAAAHCCHQLRQMLWLERMVLCGRGCGSWWQSCRKEGGCLLWKRKVWNRASLQVAQIW